MTNLEKTIPNDGRFAAVGHWARRMLPLSLYRIVLIGVCAHFAISMTACAGHRDLTEKENGLLEQEATEIAQFLGIDLESAKLMVEKTRVELHPQYELAIANYYRFNNNDLLDVIKIECKAWRKAVRNKLANRPEEILQLTRNYEDQLRVTERAKKVFKLHAGGGAHPESELAQIEFETEVDKLNAIGRQIGLPDYVPNITAK